MTDLARLTATELIGAYRGGSLSPVEVTRAALAAIDAGNDDVNAFVLVDSEGALAAAGRSAARWRAGNALGPGDGVPTSIKDILYTRGWPTLRGSHLIDERGPWTEDAPAVARLRETGAVLLGKTTTPEFGWKGVTDSLRHGPTGNPWDAALTAGGSSGGSAAAVGLGMGAWSVGTDGGGSLRIPAAFTGTVTGWHSSDWTSWTPYTYPFNLTQQPAASVPCGFTSTGLPIGLQIVGPRHADGLVLRAARAYERATGALTR